ncbi:MAG: hypothetical protein HN341_18970 [Verrucomicrobia bacterium]|nr:hypothetical protein [Verrucomicrobiota bacterium]
MILGIDKFGARLKDQYDKVLAFVVLLLLLSSLIYLGVKVGLIRQMQDEFDDWLRSRQPVNPHACVVESTVYDTAKLALDEAFQLAAVDATNTFMFVPETRFNCRECRLPVHIDADECPFCHTEVEELQPVNPDADGDGMPTVWENRYGLDPFDPADAAKDNDNDGYSNLVEYRDGEFDPTDPTKHPAAIEKMKLVRIAGKRFGLRFNSRVRTKSGYKFGLNYRLPSGETKTDFVEIGDMVAGFKITNYEAKEEMVEKPFKRKVDVSELTLVTEDGKTIVLVKGKARLHVELTAHLSLALPDGRLEELAVKNDATFELDGATHRVIDIDVAEDRVVLRDERNQREIVVSRSDENGADIPRE